MMTEENRMKKRHICPWLGGVPKPSFPNKISGFSSGFWRPIDAVMLLVYGGQNSPISKEIGSYLLLQVVVM